MELTEKVKEYIDKSILCWLATSSSEGIPNVSPKEIFTYFGIESIIIANIASPQSIRNIKENEHVCVSFIEIFVQKGFQIKGKAKLIERADPQFKEMEQELTKMTLGKFPFETIIKINVTQIKQILAPSYIFYPETKEEDQVHNAKKAYGV